MPSSRLASHPDLPLPVRLCAIRTARRMRLRLDEDERIIKVTHPRAVRASAALAWAASQKQWITERLEQVLPAEPFVPGAVIPLQGADVALVWSQAEPRTPNLQDDCIVCGGPADAFSRRIAQFLRKAALEALSRETAEAAAKAGLRAVSVRVGDARTRWGSCSSKGDIRYSWRLILAPAEVRRYVVAHEVAHLKHLNHGPKFKALERELFEGDVGAAEALLRRWGPRLRRIGRGD
ncbi:MAG TPA: YgjP-like metallopeptidase domain-containing protein [Sphingomicrobium sp.]|nr:YgjP-like metallopeptidase domain-containing protein [Sphingomicrobium sp.]